MAKRSTLKTSAKPVPPPVAADSDGKSLSELAYQAILEGLFTRKVPAGAYLSQNDLVRLLGLPVQPLRDALRILETEGVLTIHPRAGIEFLKPDLELARSTYQFRTMIERLSIRSPGQSARWLGARSVLASRPSRATHPARKGAPEPLHSHTIPQPWPLSPAGALRICGPRIP
jgi:hypothetical protein